MTVSRPGEIEQGFENEQRTNECLYSLVLKHKIVHMRTLIQTNVLHVDSKADRYQRVSEVLIETV